MSTLVAQTISNGTVSTSSANVIQGSAKAWVNFNAVGGSAVIRASYNVSSVTVNSTGKFTVNFTNAFADIGYSAQIAASGDTLNWTGDVNENLRIEDATTTTFRFGVGYNTGTLRYNPIFNCVTITR